MSHTVHIRNADWAIVWDAERERHLYRTATDVVFTDGRITHVGASWHGRADEIVEGRGRLIMPGLVNIHCHSRSASIGKGIMEELGTPTFWMSGLYDSKAVFWKGSAVAGDEDTPRAASRLTYYELLLCGVTTVLDLSAPYESWLEVVADSGLRCVLGPWYASADWITRDGHQIAYVWNEPTGRTLFEQAVKVIERANAHPSGRLSGILAPDTLDTTSVELLQDTLAIAKQRQWRLTIHCAESMVEFHEFTRRTGKTPVRYAADMGILGPNTILGHCVFIDSHSWPHWHTRDDLRLLGQSGTSVAHCPTPFSRYGVCVESLPAYREAGITLGLGTDTFPHNLLDEMRLALTLARVACEDMTRISTSDVFHMATVGGARALGRSDIGRIAPGCRADLVSVDLDHPSMRPLRDPLRSLIYSAAERAVRDVWVDGRQVVVDGRVPHIDAAGAAITLERAQRRAEEAIPTLDWAGRSARQLSPLTLDLV